MAKIFCSYSHSDEDIKIRLSSHLESVGLNTWSDRKIPPGGDWDGTIKKELNDADVILFLISVDFNTSKYCKDVEVKTAIERHEKEEAICIPIFVKECGFENQPYSNLQGLPRDAKFVTDTAHWSSIDKPLTIIAKEIKERVTSFLAERESIEDSLPEASEQKIVDSDEDVIAAMKMFLEKRKNLNYGTEPEELKNILQLGDGLINAITSVQENIENTPKLAEANTYELFNKIYNSPKLSKALINEITTLRNSEKYQWYQRSLIVSAITVSLLIHKSIDHNKVITLIDFVNDNEEQVWEKALTGLVIALVYKKNAWLRFNNVKLKLSGLRDKSNVQNALSRLSFLLESQTYEIFPIKKELYSIQFLKEQPANSFIPFYKDNPATEYFLENYTSDNAIQTLDVLDKLPYPDFIKYHICYSIKSKSNNQIDSYSKQHINYISMLFDISAAFYPFIQTITEIRGFLKYYQEQNKELFDKQFSVANTRLKDIVFNEIEKHKLVATNKMKTQEWKSAAEEWRKVIKIKKDVSALGNLAICLENIDQYNEEIKVREEIVSMAPKDTDNILRIAEILITEKSDYTKAIDTLDLIIDKENNYYYWMSLGEAHIYKKEYNIALKAYKRANGINETVSSLIEISKCYKEAKKAKQSIKYCKKALNINPQHTLALAELAMTYLYFGNIRKSIKSFNKAIKTDENNYSLFYAKGMIYLYMDDPDSALDCFDSAINNNDTDHVLFRDRAKSHYLMGNHSKALSDIKTAIKLDDTDVDTYLTQGLIYQKIKDFDNVVKSYKTAYKVNNSPEAMSSLAHIYAQLNNDIESAYYLSLLEKSNLTFYLITKASILQDKEEYNESIKILDSLIKEDNQIFSAFFLRSQAYIKLKNYSLALNDANEADRIASNKKDINEKHAIQLICIEIYFNLKEWDNLYGLLEKLFSDKIDVNNIDREVLQSLSTKKRFTDISKKYNQKILPEGSPYNRVMLALLPYEKDTDNINITKLIP